MREMYYKTTYSSPAGILTLASDGENLIGLWIHGQKYHGDSIFKDMKVKNDLPVFKETKKWLESYFKGKNPSIKILPLAPVGTDFRKLTWDILCKIPYGKTCTYGDIAKTISKIMNIKSMSSQAVGGAVGHNPISIIIPCHRVVGTNRSLTGYAGGIEKKLQLLTLEGVDLAGLQIID